MCQSGPSVDNSYQEFQMAEAKRARAEEEARQARISEGMKQIAAIFEGGTTAPVITPAQTVQQQIRIPGREGWTTSSIDGRLFQGKKAYGHIPAQTVLKDVFIPATYGPTQTFEGMQPALDQRKEAMEGYYLPQLDKKFADAKEDLGFALSRAGLKTSSVAGTKQGELAELFALERAALDNTIKSDLASTRSRINQNRASIEAALRASGDATAATNSALSSASVFRDDVPELNPLGDLFFGIAEGIGSSRDGYEAERIRKIATPNPLNKGTGRVVRA